MVAVHAGTLPRRLGPGAERLDAGDERCTVAAPDICCVHGVSLPAPRTQSLESASMVA